MTDSNKHDKSWQHRYARQIALDGWGESGQRRLGKAKVMIVGLGGLGSPVATYLASAGVGHLVLNDFDHVDVTNLARQPLHGTDDVDQPKTQSALTTLERINPTVKITLITERLDKNQLIATLDGVDLLIDCSDNFRTRFLLNEAAHQTQTVLISAAAIRTTGQVIAFDNTSDQSPCYRCLYQDHDESMEDCQGQGVVTPLVGVIGSYAALLATNYIVFERHDFGKLHCFDSQHLKWHTLSVNKNSQCPVCS